MNDEKEITEARDMWAELEGRSDTDAMNAFHRIQLDRLEVAHRRDVDALECEIIRRGIVNEELTEINAGLRHRLDYFHLALFACALVIGYLAVRG